MKKHAGFTLIELIAVMVILAILAVVAIPQFIDLRVQAANAAAAGVGGAIASGTALNFSRGVSGAGGAVVITACNGTQLDDVIVGETAPGATSLTVNGRVYTLATVTAPAAGSGNSGVCSIRDNSPGGTTAQNFTIISCATAPNC